MGELYDECYDVNVRESYVMNVECYDVNVRESYVMNVMMSM